MINQIRGFLIERGIIVRQGVMPLRKALPDILSSNAGTLSPRMVNLIAELVQDWRRLDERIAAVSTEIESLTEQDEGCRRVTSASKRRGVLQVDGYAGFERLTDRGDIVLAACWAHTRRKFFDVHEATGSPIAAEALRRIAELYAIEKSIRGRTAEERRSVRDTQSRPLVEAMKPWLEAQLGRIPGRGGLADAIRYTLSRWPALCHFLDDGRIELDNNSVERAIRPVALGRKNHLFAGSDGGAERKWPYVTVTTLLGAEAVMGWAGPRAPRPRSITCHSANG